MNILVIGGGGREHAIVKSLAKSPRANKIWCAPGNGGISDIAECLAYKATDIEGILDFVKTNPVDLTVVAPDDPLALGMVDKLTEAGFRAFGPTKNAAILESSKVFSKNLMQKYGIPTAKYNTFTDIQAALDYVRQQGAPIVVKADGLALGKGVVVAQTVEQAEDAIHSIMGDKLFGDAGSSLVIEEFMAGKEVTVLCFTDGKTIVPMLPSRDHKRAFDNDEGPNTGGMGAFCPVPDFTPELMEQCMRNIFRPTVEAMNTEGRTFKGVLYFGLMLTPNGPKVVEYNARFGDPETQPILSMLETDLLDIFEAIVDERLDNVNIKWRSGAACCVVMSSGGYPAKYETGYEISGLEEIPENITIFHAGTKKIDGKYFTSGGRVLGITAVANDLETAIKQAYANVSSIYFKDCHFRHDIGKSVL